MPDDKWRRLFPLSESNEPQDIPNLPRANSTYDPPDQATSPTESRAPNIVEHVSGKGESVRETITRSMREVEAKSGSGAANGKDSDRNFSVALTAYGAVLATGLLLLGESNWFSGAVFTLGGGAGLMSVTPLFRAKFETFRSPRSLWAVILMTWLFLAANLGFSIYDSLGRKPISSGSDFYPAAAPEPMQSEIIDVTPEYLMSLYKDVMSSQGDRLLAPYVSKWIRLTQTVADVSGNSVWTYAKDPAATRTIILDFDPNWTDRLSILTHDQKIAALCQITPVVKVNIIRMAHCRLESK